MGSIPESLRDLFEKRTIAHFVTMHPDGLPHATPVWIDYDAGDDRVLVNTMQGRRKERNVREDPRVAASMLDPDDEYRYLSVAGEVEDVTRVGAVEHINALTRRYTGADEYPNLDEEEGPRVILRIRPERVIAP